MIKFLRKALLMTLPFIFAMPSPATETSAQVPGYLVNHDLLVPQLQWHETRGEFSKAEALLLKQLSNSTITEEERTACRNELERLRRLRRDYAQTAQEVVEKLKKDIPDVTVEDIEQWRQEGVIQWLPVDGKAGYFRREPSNLYRFSADARTRRAAAAKARSTAPEGDPAARESEAFVLNDYIAEVLATAKKKNEAIVMPVRFKVRQTVTVDAGAVPAGEMVRCWMPLAQDYRQQTGSTNIKTSPAEHQLSPPGAFQRTIYMEQPAVAGEPIIFKTEFEYTNAAYAPVIDPEKIKDISDPSGEVQRSLMAKEPHLEINSAVERLAREIVGKETNPYRKAEKIFRWMDENVRYCSEMEYSVMTSVSEKMMTEYKGDCGMHVLMFVALCRAAGVPARWQSGWVNRPGHENIHDWAEFYAEPYGWIPADPSMGLRQADDKAVADFYFGHIDAYRMIANMDFCEEFIPEKQHWRSDPIDNQRGEVEWSGGNLYYDQWTYNIETLERVSE